MKMETTQQANQVSINPLTAILLVAVGILGYKAFFDKPTPVPAVVAPVAPVVTPTVDKFKVLASTADPKVANRFAAFHGAVADVFSRVEPNSLRTGQFRAWMASSEVLYIAGSDLRGALPGYSEACNEAYKTALGDEDVLIDVDRKQKLVDTAKAIQESLRR